MAKANIVTSAGTKITIDGTDEEISRILKQYSDEPAHKKLQPQQKSGERKQGGKLSIRDVVREMTSEGFFNKPIGLGQVKSGLAERGHHLPITTLSGVMLALTKDRTLRRLKENGVWSYAKL